MEFGFLDPLVAKHSRSFFWEELIIIILIAMGLSLLLIYSMYPIYILKSSRFFDGYDKSCAIRISFQGK